jgi:hypothetical protein
MGTRPGQPATDAAADLPGHALEGVRDHAGVLPRPGGVEAVTGPRVTQRSSTVPAWATSVFWFSAVTSRIANPSNTGTRWTACRSNPRHEEGPGALVAPGPLRFAVLPPPPRSLAVAVVSGGGHHPHVSSYRPGRAAVLGIVHASGQLDRRRVRRGIDGTEDHAIVLDVPNDQLPRAELTHQDPLGQHILDLALDRPP